MTMLAGIDCGTNSTRLLIADTGARPRAPRPSRRSNG